jgi:hypothetical protein
LLDGRRRHPRAREFLFGDDFEKDAFAYSLYARILSGELQGRDAVRELEREGVPKDDIDCILRMRSALKSPLGTVERAFIHLERRSSPEIFAPLGPLVTPVRGSFQLCLALFALDLVDPRAVTETASAIRATSVFRRLDLDALMTDAIHRGLISQERARELPLL